MKPVLVLCAAITFAVLSGRAAAVPPTGQDGDTNNDDAVDLVDLNNVENNFGGTGLGDANPTNSIVDIGDLNGVRNNLGASEQGSIPPAPVSSDWGIRLSSQVHSAFTPVTLQPVSLPDISGPVAVPLTYRIDLFLEFQSRAIDQVGFGNVMFDIALNGLTASTALPQWQGDSTQIGSADKWAHSDDYGVSQTDLKHIVAGLQPRNLGAQGSDPRWTIGQNGPEFLGSLFVDWDGQSQRKLEFTVAQHSYYDANRQLHLSGEGVQNASILFGEQLQVVPEPASIAVWACLGLTAAGIQWRRRGKNSKSVA